MFNFVEKNPSSEYWEKGNFGECVLDIMKDCEDVLRSGKLPNSFNTGDNILVGKDKAVLGKLADFLRDKRDFLVHI